MGECQPRSRRMAMKRRVPRLRQTMSWLINKWGEMSGEGS
jgi:hypothetical protein